MNEMDGMMPDWINDVIGRYANTDFADMVKKQRGVEIDNLNP